MTMRLTMKIRGEKAHTVECETFEQAATLVRDTIEATGIGSSAFEGANLRGGSGKLRGIIGHVSYNGRVWAGTARSWTKATKLLWSAPTRLDQEEARSMFGEDFGLSPDVERGFDKPAGRLFWSQQGEVSCRAHGPGYLTDTWRNDRWKAMTGEEITSFSNEIGRPVDCETCEAKKRAVAKAKVLHVIDRDGLSLCCRAMTTIDEHGVEYCKGCYKAIENPGPATRVEV